MKIILISVLSKNKKRALRNALGEYEIIQKIEDVKKNFTIDQLTKIRDLIKGKKADEVVIVGRRSGLFEDLISLKIYPIAILDHPKRPEELEVSRVIDANERSIGLIRLPLLDKRILFLSQEIPAVRIVLTKINEKYPEILEELANLRIRGWELWPLLRKYLKSKKRFIKNFQTLSKEEISNEYSP